MREDHWILALFLLGTLSYIALWWTVPIRKSLQDGGRVVSRYPVFVSLPILFGLSYSAYKLILGALMFSVLPEGVRPEFHLYHGWNSPVPLEVLKAGLLPTLENVSGLFNTSVPAFPLSAICAFLFFINWRRCHREFLSVLRKRYRKTWLPLYLSLLVFGIAALLKPAIYLVLPLVAESPDVSLFLKSAAVVDWLSFMFETLLGTLVHVYLISLGLAWVRGIRVKRKQLLEFMLHRFGYVLKWSILIMLAGSVFIHLPLLWPQFHDGQTLGWMTAGDWPRVTLPILIMVFCTMQITLCLHNDSLRTAIKENFKFLKKHRYAVIWLLVFAATSFFVIEVLNAWVVEGFGSDSLLSSVWGLAFTLVKFAFTGWLIAVWVCLYKRCETGFTLMENYVKY